MRKSILILVLIFLAITGISNAYRTPKPQRITDFDQRGLVALNESLEQIWDLTNGRYNLTLVTVNPAATVSGNAGDMVLLKSGVNYYLEVCIGGTAWVGEQLTITP